MTARIEEHRAILAAFEARDPASAAKAAARRVCAAGDEFLETMRQTKGDWHDLRAFGQASGQLQQALDDAHVQVQVTPEDRGTVGYGSMRGEAPNS